MGEILGQLPWATVTPSGVLLMVVLLVLRGSLVPRKTLDDVREERDYWRQAAEERSAQLNKLLPSVDVSTRMIEAIVQANRDRDQQ